MEDINFFLLVKTKKLQKVPEMQLSPQMNCSEF